MAAKDRKPIASPRHASKPDPQTPVTNMVEGRINALTREKAHLIEELVDAKLRCKGLERKFNSARDESHAKFKTLEDMIERPRTENEKVNSLNESLKVWVMELESDIAAAKATLDATRQGFQQSHIAISDAYQRLEDASIKSKHDLQKAWTKCKELQEENDSLTDKDGQHFLENHELRRLNGLLHDELRWYETQENAWMDTDKLNQNRFAKLNAEILTCLHVYGQLNNEKVKNQALQEKNARLQYDLDKLRLDVEADNRLKVMKGLSDI